MHFESSFTGMIKNITVELIPPVLLFPTERLVFHFSETIC